MGCGFRGSTSALTSCLCSPFPAPPLHALATEQKISEWPFTQLPKWTALSHCSGPLPRASIGGWPATPLMMRELRMRLGRDRESSPVAGWAIPTVWQGDLRPKTSSHGSKPQSFIFWIFLSLSSIHLDILKNFTCSVFKLPFFFFFKQKGWKSNSLERKILLALLQVLFSGGGQLWRQGGVGSWRL